MHAGVMKRAFSMAIVLVLLLALLPSVPYQLQAAAADPPAANTAAAISYSYTEGGTYTFVNDPEPIGIEHLADTTTGSTPRWAMFSGTFTGINTIYYEHNNESGNSIYYGVYFYNNNSYSVTLKLLANGASFGWTTNCFSWERYFGFSGSGTTYTLAANSGQWIYFTKASGDIDRPAPNGTTYGGARSHTGIFNSTACSIPVNTFDGVMKVESSAELEIRVLAFRNASYANSSSAILRNTVYYNTPSEGGTTGYSPYLAEVTGNFAWTINDSTGLNNLPVRLNNQNSTYWVTNTTDRYNQALRSDCLPITIRYNDGPYTLRYNENDPRTNRAWGWANWGVIYNNNFTITNDGTKPQTVSYYIGRTNSINRYISTYSPLSGYKELPFSDINNWLDKDQRVLSITIQPGETKTMPVQVVLGGQSYGGVRHYLVVEEPLDLTADGTTIENHHWMASSVGYSQQSALTAQVNNTSDAALTAMDITLSGEYPEAFVLSKTKTTALTANGSDTFTVRPANGLPAGFYRARVSVSSVGFDVSFMVYPSHVLDYLTLAPAGSWETLSGKVENSFIVVSAGAYNSDGVRSLVFQNTQGVYPSANAFYPWKSGANIKKPSWANTWLVYDVSVQESTSINLFSGSNTANSLITMSQPIFQTNTLGGGGLESGSNDLMAGTYKGKMTLEYLVDNRYDHLGNKMTEAFSTTDFYMDGWRVYAVGNAPATVSVNMFKLILLDTDANIVANNADALTWDDICGSNILQSYVTDDLSLPTSGEYDSWGNYATTVTWSSSHPEYIAADGTVQRPIYTIGDTTVTLTATIKRNAATTTKSLTLRVLALPHSDLDDIFAVAMGLTWNTIRGTNTTEIAVITDLTLPTLIDDVTISWSASNATISSSGVVTRPAYASGDAAVTLTATFSKGVAEAQKSFGLTVLKQAPTDAEAVAAVKALLTWNAIRNLNTMQASVTSALTLPTALGEGVTIAWQSSNSAVIAASGAVTRPAYGNGDASVTVSATLTKGSASDSVTFVVTVPELPQSDAAAVSEAKTLLTWDAIKGSNSSQTAVTTNLSLPTTLGAGVTVSWQSSDTAVLSQNGTVTRPTYAVGDKTVTLTATLTKGSATDTKVFTVTVSKMPYSDTQAVADAKALLTWDAIKGTNSSQSNVTAKLTLPATLGDGVTVTWSSANSAIAITGVVTRPSGSTVTGAITATLTKGSATDTVSFTLTVPKQDTGGGYFPPPEPSSFTVTFNTQGGSTVAAQTVADGGTAVKPTDPTREGAAFGGWFTDASCTKAYDFNTAVTQGITLYAKWNTVHTVTFNTQGGGKTVTQEVADGESATPPSAPTRDGAIFEGWFLDLDGSQAYDFTAAVTESFTLYAKWTVVWTAEDKPHDWAKQELLEAVDIGLVPEDLQQNYRGNMLRLDFCRVAVSFIEVVSGQGIEDFLASKGLSLHEAFSDCDDLAVRAAAALGIVDGVGNGLFMPEGEIDRASAAKMLALTVKALGRDISQAPQTDYDDQSDIHSWANDNVNFVSHIGVMGNTSGIEGIYRFSPDASYTVEQSLVTFARLYAWWNA